MPESARSPRGAGVRGLHRLEEVQNVLRARGSPQRKEPMVGVRKRPPTADGDEAGVAILGEDHGVGVPTWPSLVRVPPRWNSDARRELDNVNGSI